MGATPDLVVDREAVDQARGATVRISGINVAAMQTVRLGFAVWLLGRVAVEVR